MSISANLLELFGKTLVPEFKARDEIRQREKAAELAPYIEAALKRKQRMAPLKEDGIPTIDSFGRRAEAAKIGVAQGETFSDCGGAISIPMSRSRTVSKR